jgi:glutathione S-transferase
MSIAEWLAELFPQRVLCRQRPAHRARALRLFAEMCAGFSAVRGDCPMSVETSLPEAGTLRDKPEMGADSARIVVLWPEVLRVHKGSMLCCRFSIG